MQLITFLSTREVIKAEAVLAAATIKVRVVPLPVAMTAQCGLGLEIEDDEMAQVDDILKDNDITYKRQMAIK